MGDNLRQSAPRQRCHRHGIAVAPDGRCVLCRRDGRARAGPTSITARAILAWGVFGAGGVAAALIVGDAPTRQVPRGNTKRVRAELPAVRARSSAAEAQTPGVSTSAPVARRRDSAPLSGDNAVEPAHERSTRPSIRQRPRSRARSEARPAVSATDPSARDRQALAARRRMDATYQRLALQQAAERVQITLYITPWCPACRKARRWLRSSDISATEINIETDGRGRQALLRLNPRGTIPTWQIDGRVLVGFSPSRIQQAILGAARRRMTSM